MCCFTFKGCNSARPSSSWAWGGGGFSGTNKLKQHFYSFIYQGKPNPDFDKWKKMPATWIASVSFCHFLSIPMHIRQRNINRMYWLNLANKIYLIWSQTRVPSHTTAAILVAITTLIPEFSQKTLNLRYCKEKMAWQTAVKTMILIQVKTSIELCTSWKITLRNKTDTSCRHCSKHRASLR